MCLHYRFHLAILEDLEMREHGSIQEYLCTYIVDASQEEKQPNP